MLKTRRKPGPQAMPKDQKKSVRMQVPVDKPMHDAIARAARRRKLTVPAFVRVAVERLLAEVEQ